MKTANEYLSKKILIVEDQFITANHLNLILTEKGYDVIGTARSVKEALKCIEKNKPDLVILDVFLEGNETGIDLSAILQSKHIGYIYLSANSNQQVLDLAKQTQPYGFIVKPFKDEDIITTLEIAFYRHDYSIESKLLQIDSIEKKVQQIISHKYSKSFALIELAKFLQPYIPFSIIEVREPSRLSGMSIIREKLDIYTEIDRSMLDKFKNDASPHAASFDNMNTSPAENNIIYNESRYWDFCQLEPDQKMFTERFGIRSFISRAASRPQGQFMQLIFHSRQSDVYKSGHLELLNDLHSAFANFLAYFFENNEAAQEPETVVDDTNRYNVFNGHIGQSHRVLTVFDYVRRVAPKDISVLILGESGTGKEKVADLIHKLSDRAEKPLVIINCGAIPDSLAESVLFGHEKGSFTDAFEKRIGKFEQAQGGTIFLDEIAEMPMAIQVKLLRVLQEQEIEPVGGKSPVKLDVRIIAATNKNLEEEIANGKFRMDLYYRLHVFPIELPSLRERREDIIPLANYFVQAYCDKIGSTAPTLSMDAQHELISYSWPGNIRELENVIYRNVLLNDGDQISNIKFANLQKSDSNSPEFEYQVKSFDDNERDFILAMLKRCNGKVSGAGGAAELIGLPTSTLTSKMKKLGIFSSNRY